MFDLRPRQGAMTKEYHQNKSLVSQLVVPYEPVFAEATVVALLIALAIIIRLPFFFPATIDSDESTFILIGQGILDGMLPYDSLWDIKPPLVYLFFAAAIEIFGNNVASVRLAGCLWVAAAAYLTYRSAFVITVERRASVAASILVIIATTLFTPGVMSETLALVPLVGAFLLLLTTEKTPSKCFFAGVLIGTAVLFRTNLAYLAVFVGLYLVLYPPIVSFQTSALRGVAYAAGGIIIVLLTAIPYVFDNRLELWFDSLFVAAWEYSARPVWQSTEPTRQLVMQAFGFSPYPGYPPLDITYFLLGCVLWLGGVLGVLISLHGWWNLAPPARNMLSMLLTFLVGSVISIFMTGPPFAHYLTQAIPWFAIFSAVAVAHRSLGTHRLIIELTALASLAASTALFVAEEYSGMIRRIMDHKRLSYGVEYDVASYLKKENPDHKPVYMLCDNLVYWLINQYPLTRFSADPPQITYEFLLRPVEPDATPQSEMRKILSKKPAFVVKKKDVPYFPAGAEVTQLFYEALKKDYVLKAVIGGREVYRRVD
jgi:4-amino-4-deoxy-L-arabinose transferase-like glycosyltransferase